MLCNKRNGYTMMELIFVIVILGILAAVAIPKLAGTRDDAQIAKGRSDVAAIRSAIVSERQGRLLQGSSSYISKLDKSGSDGLLFDDNDTNTTNGSLLQYGIKAGSGNGEWAKVDGDTYSFTATGTSVNFDYNNANGTFSCTRGTTASGQLCEKLID